MRARASTALALSLVAATAHATDDVRPEQRHPHARPGKGGTEGAFGNALRLARMLGDDKTVARLLMAQAGSPAASADDVAAAVEALENVDKPADAVSLLRARVARFPKERESLVLLAELLARDGDSNAAAAVWKQLDVNPFALKTPEVVVYARDLARVGRDQEAFDVLKLHTLGVTDAETEFWHDLATLAWELDDEDTALTAYKKTWDKDPHRVNVAPRLMNLAKEHGQIDLALEVALADYKDTHEPTTLLFAAALEVERSHWPAAKRILALADAEPGKFARRVEYWTLKGEVFTQLGELKVASKAYRVVLSLRPASTDAQAAVLWYDIQAGSRGELSRDLDQWRTSAEANEDLWKPYAVGLDHLGRTREAIAFYARDVRAHPEDDTAALDLADALDRIGYGTMSERLRRHAMGRRQREAIDLLHKHDASSEDIAKLTGHIDTVRKHAGVAMADRWLEAAMANHRGDQDLEDFALDVDMEEGRTDRARRLLWRNLAGARVAEHRLALAIEDDDYGTVRRILSEPKNVSAESRADAADFLEDDTLEREYLKMALTGEGTQADRTTLTSRFRDIELRHLPNIKVGATYTYIEGLNAMGPDASVSHDIGPLRLLYTAYGRAMTVDGSTSLTLTTPRLEADLGVTLRGAGARWATEVTAAFDFQPDRPLPRAAFLDERLLGKFFSTRIDAAFDEPIVDTAFLRLEGVRSRLTVEGRADFAKHFYASAYVEGLEDHTREFSNLSYGVEETAEVGYKLVRGEPEWDVGVQAIAVQRQNVTALPKDVVVQYDPTDLTKFLPPSYQEVLAVTHFVRGDFAERFQRERTAFPRYDCEAGAGVLIANGEPAAALHLQCSVSFRVFRTGYVSALGFYDLGVAGVANDQSAQAGLYYTQPL